MIHQIRAFLIVSGLLATPIPSLHSVELKTATSEYRPDFGTGWKEEYTYYDPGHVRHGLYRYWVIDGLGFEFFGVSFARH